MKRYLAVLTYLFWGGSTAAAVVGLALGIVKGCWPGESRWWLLLAALSIAYLPLGINKTTDSLFDGSKL